MYINSIFKIQNLKYFSELFTLNFLKLPKYSGWRKLPVYNQSGQTLVELLVAIGVSAVLLPALIIGIFTSREGKPQQIQRLQASALLRETEEAVRNIREASWNNISTNGTYFLTLSGAIWQLTTTSQPAINGFTRTIVISSVQRDSSGNIVTYGGTVDPSTKQIVATVSWSSPFASSVSSTFYLTRYLNSATFTQSSPTPFTTYTSTGSSNVVVTANSVQLNLAGSGRGNWCTTNANAINTLDLAGSGVAKAIWAIQGTAFAGTGDNASGLPLADIAITNPASPANPASSVSWTYNPGGSTKTNDLFGDSNYSYLATDKNNEEVMVISNSTHTKVTSFDTPGSSNASSLFVLNNIGYVVAGSNLYLFDMSTVTGTSRATSSSVALSSTGTSVKVIQVPSGTYIFVAESSTSKQLEVFKGNGLNAPTLIGSKGVTGQAGKDIAILSDGTKAYLVTGSSSTQKEFFVIDTSPILSGSAPGNVLASYDTNGMDPRGVAVVLNGNRAIIVGSGGSHQYQVVDLRASPLSECGWSADPANNGVIYDVSAVTESDGDSYAYIVTNNASAEFQIIEGGAGGQYATSGVYESTTFDPGSVSSFNRFSVTFDQPTGTQIKFQVAVAATGVSGTCSDATFSYVGPNGDAAQYFTSSGTGTLTLNATIPFSSSGSYQNPGRCFRYKAYLYPSSDYTQTPTINSNTISYTP